MNPGSQRSRPPILFSVRLQTRPSPCGSCGEITSPGLVGWYQGHSDGPLCLMCLLENDPELGSIVATVQLVREVGAMLRQEVPQEGQEALNLLSLFARHYDRFASNRWPRQPLDFLACLKVAVGYDSHPEDIN